MSSAGWLYYCSVVACVVVLWASAAVTAVLVAALVRLRDAAEHASRAAVGPPVTYRGRHRQGAHP